MARGAQHCPELPHLNVGPPSHKRATSQPSRKSTTSRRAKAKARENGKGKGKPNNNNSHNNNYQAQQQQRKRKEGQEQQPTALPEAQLQQPDVEGLQQPTAAKASTTTTTTRGKVSPINRLLMFLQNIFVCTTYNDNQHDLPPQLNTFRHLGPVVQDITSTSSINTGIYLVDLDINMVNREFLDGIPATCQRHWALLCDTGAVSSVAPITFVLEIKLQLLDARVQLSTANGDNIKMHGYKDVDIIIGGINMYVRFYICDVSAPILGVNDLVSNNVELNLSNFQDSYRQQHGQQALLQYIGVVISTSQQL